MDLGHYIKNVWAEISELQKKANGEGVKVAVLDGPIDTTHPCFTTKQISSTTNKITPGLATVHGTHVASILLADNQEKLRGVCPGVELISIPIFRERADGNIIPSSQLELARAIEQALNAGADIINISAGEKVMAAEPQRRLEKTIERCIEQEVLLVSAAGNNGCPCIHVPAVHPNVLAVGALDQRGYPMDFSNWGKPYQFNGIMAPGQDILGAAPGGGYAQRSGTSFATPIVTGVVALLYSYFKNNSSYNISPLTIREAIIHSAHDCPLESTDSGAACDRFLKGILNIAGAFSYLEEAPQQQKAVTVSAVSMPLESPVNLAVEQKGVQPSQYHMLSPPPPPLVYAIGKLDIEFETDAVLDSFKFYMQGLCDDKGKRVNYPDPYNPRHLLNYLETQGEGGYPNSFEAKRLSWIIKQGGTPIYAIKPSGPFSELAYRLLVRFLEPSDEVEEHQFNLCSISGHIVGQSKLRTGQVLPLIKT